VAQNVTSIEQTFKQHPLWPLSQTYGLLSYLPDNSQRVLCDHKISFESNHKLRQEIFGRRFVIRVILDEKFQHWTSFIFDQIGWLKQEGRRKYNSRPSSSSFTYQRSIYPKLALWYSGPYASAFGVYQRIELSVSTASCFASIVTSTLHTSRQRPP
jgi:hypothetical protein